MKVNFSIPIPEGKVKDLPKFATIDIEAVVFFDAKEDEPGLDYTSINYQGVNILPMLDSFNADDLLQFFHGKTIDHAKSKRYEQVR